MTTDRSRVRTERLLLRRPAADDRPFLLELLSDPATTEHDLPDALTVLTEAEALLLRWSTHWAAGLGHWIVEIAADGPIGVCGVRAVDVERRPAWNLLHRVAPSARGRGYAREAAAEAVRVAHAVDPSRIVVARVRPANLASARVAAALGFHRRPELDLLGDDGLDEVRADRATPMRDARTP